MEGTFETTFWVDAIRKTDVYPDEYHGRPSDEAVMMFEGTMIFPYSQTRGV